MVVQGAAVSPVFTRRRCRTEPTSSHSERRSSSPLAPPPAKQVPGGFSMLTATCMQRGESRAAVMMVQGAAAGPVFARRRCRTEPASSHSERRSSSPLAPPPARQVPGSFSMLTATCMQRGKSRAAVMVVQGAAVGPVFARRRCRTEPASSHSERRSSSPLAPPPAKQVPGSFSMLTATCMQRGKSRAAVMVVQGAAVGPVCRSRRLRERLGT